MVAHAEHRAAGQEGGRVIVYDELRPHPTKEQYDKLALACRLFGVRLEDVATAGPSVGAAIERAGQQFIADVAKWAVEKYQRP